MSKLAARKNANSLKTQPPSEDEAVCSEITFYHCGGEKNKDTVFLAILDKFTCDPNVKKLDYTRDYYPQAGTTIYSEADRLYMKCETINLDDQSGVLNDASIRVYSLHHGIDELRRTIGSILRIYQINRNNDLRETRYFFDQQPFQILYGAEDAYGRQTIDYSHMPKEFAYKKFPMTTYRTLNNIYGEKIKLIRRRVEHFSNVEWYQRTGAARTLGFLLAGPPGCGKTMLIQAIANTCGRHVINEDICVEDPFNDRKKNTVTIPFEQRLYVFEEVDVSCDFLRRPVEHFDPVISGSSATAVAVALESEGKQHSGSRRSAASSSSSSSSSSSASRRAQLRNASVADLLSGNDGDSDERNYRAPTCTPPNIAQSNPEKPKLSDFLTLLDGVYETTGRIAIMTTNHPEMLDPALIRSGRFEFIKLEKFSYTETKEMFMGMYQMPSEMDESGNLHPAFEILEKIPDGTWSPAEIGSAIDMYYDDPDSAAEYLYEEYVIRSSNAAASAPASAPASALRVADIVVNK